MVMPMILPTMVKERETSSWMMFTVTDGNGHWMSAHSKPPTTVDITRMWELSAVVREIYLITFLYQSYPCRYNACYAENINMTI